MAKKSQKSESIGGIFKEIFGGLADIGINAIIGNVRHAAQDAMEEAQKRLEVTTVKVLKSATIFILMIFGLILVVVGFGSWLSANVPSLSDGMGHVVVGAIIMGLGLLIQFFKN